MVQLQPIVEFSIGPHLYFGTDLIRLNTIASIAYVPPDANSNCSIGDMSCLQEQIFLDFPPETIVEISLTGLLGFLTFPILRPLSHAVFKKLFLPASFLLLSGSLLKENDEHAEESSIPGILTIKLFFAITNGFIN